MAKILISELEGDALDWAAASFSGLAMREPVHATNQDLEGLTVPFTLYESSYVYRNEKLIGVKSSPITVTRFGINTAVGATAPSISFTDANGRQSLGSVRNYFLDPKEAELEALAALKGSFEDFHPSTNSEQFTEILKKEKINLSYSDGIYSLLRGWTACIHGHSQDGPDPLIAATRCFVSSKSKEDWVEVPDDLVEAPRELERPKG